MRPRWPSACNAIRRSTFFATFSTLHSRILFRVYFIWLRRYWDAKRCICCCELLIITRYIQYTANVWMLRIVQNLVKSRSVVESHRVGQLVRQTDRQIDRLILSFPVCVIYLLNPPLYWCVTCKAEWAVSWVRVGLAVIEICLLNALNQYKALLSTSWL